MQLQWKDENFDKTHFLFKFILKLLKYVKTKTDLKTNCNHGKMTDHDYIHIKFWTW